MLPKTLRKTIFSLLHHFPAVLRDHVCRSRLHIPPLTDDLVFDLARSRQDLDQAFLLLHDAYVNEGYSKPHASRRRITDYHALPSTSTLVAKCKGAVVATVSIIRDSYFGLPADVVMDVSMFRNKAERIGEVSSLAIKPEFRGRSGEVLFYLFKFLYHYCSRYFGLDRLVIVVHPNRIALYQSILLFQPLHRSAIKSYGFVNNAPAVCATLDLLSAEQGWRRAYEGKPDRQNIYRFFTAPLNRREADQMRFPDRPYYTVTDPVMTPEILDYFYNHCSEGMCQLAAERIEILKSIYTDHGYDAIWPPCDAAGWHNKRSQKRFEVDCPAGRDDRSGVSQGESTRVLDVCRRGIRLCTTDTLAAWNAIPLRIAIADKATVCLNTKLKWRCGRLHGLEILQVDPPWQHFIDCLERRLSVPFHATAIESFVEQRSS